MASKTDFNEILKYGAIGIGLLVAYRVISNMSLPSLTSQSNSISPVQNYSTGNPTLDYIAQNWSQYNTATRQKIIDTLSVNDAILLRQALTNMGSANLILNASQPYYGSGQLIYDPMSQGISSIG